MPRRGSPPLPSQSLLLVVALAGCLLATGCGGSGHHRGRPDLAALLRQPVATPSTCGAQQSGATAGRKSPWVGAVDVSVFVTAAATPAQVTDLGAQLRALPPVQAVYFESADEAYAEFQRLYTCSADVPRSAVPASYRLVLRTGVTRPQRDDVVAQIRRLQAVESVSCDPSSPCLPG